MTDTPASWQPDPTGRHDHRYWDGLRWTDHVADAGVAGTDPYDDQDVVTEGTGGSGGEGEAVATTGAVWAGGVADEPAAADEAAAEGPTGDVGAEDVTSVQSWDRPADDAAPAAAASGWGAAEADAPTAEEPAGTPPPASGWARPDEPAPTVSEWGSTASGWSGTAAGTGGEDADATSLAPGSSWEDKTVVTDAMAETTSTWTAPAGPIPHPSAAEGATAPPPYAAPGEAGPPTGDGRSKRLLLLLLALVVIVGVIVALVLMGDDDEGGGDADEIAERISATLQDDLAMEDGPADCIGEHIVDEIGASRLQDVDFDAPEAPADLEDDFNAAFNAAIAECDLDPEDLSGAADGDAAGGGEGDDEADGEGDISDPEEFAQQLAASYGSTLGISEEKATCLAERMVQAVESGELTQDEAFGEFFQYLEGCQISLEELNPTTAAG
jgi:hypothetical protein